MHHRTALQRQAALEVRKVHSAPQMARFARLYSRKSAGYRHRTREMPMSRETQSLRNCLQEKFTVEEWS
jgi:hypothetical protein